MCLRYKKCETRILAGPLTVGCHNCTIDKKRYQYSSVYFRGGCGTVQALCHKLFLYIFERTAVELLARLVDRKGSTCCICLNCVLSLLSHVEAAKTLHYTTPPHRWSTVPAGSTASQRTCCTLISAPQQSIIGHMKMYPTVQCYHSTRNNLTDAI